MNHDNFRFIPDPDQRWQEGKTAPSLRFAKDAEAVLLQGRVGIEPLRYKNGPHAAFVLLAGELIKIKTGERVLTAYVTVEDFLKHGFPT